MFCGNFNRRLQARAAQSAQNEGGLECVARPRALRAADTAQRDGDGDFESRTQGVPTDGVSEFRGIRLASPFLRRMERLQAAERERKPGTPEEAMFNTRAFENGLVAFKVYTRSTQGILYYLGEITRRRLFTEFGDTARTIQAKTSLRYGVMPLSDCNDLEDGAAWHAKSDMIYLSRRRSGGERPRGSYYCENLFVVDADGFLGDHVVGVSYDGMHFGVPRDPNRSGRTLQVLELVKQLLALNTAAKQLPSTSVISVIGQ
jgi:hypothetical protein